MKRADKNRRILLALIAGVFLMIGLAYASVPLYNLFCRVTGFGGTVQRATVAPTQIKERMVTVSFDANTDPALPWDFAPETRSVRVRLGETVTVKYRARNRSDKLTTGTSTFNVQPDRAGEYFNKIECFCFEKQALKPGQTMEFPVQFFVDPAMADDPQNKDVDNITLSYTFFPVKKQAK
ncbi:MAG: cytochrome c oxidase assembly protein [Alphaproteobacteria bacterium]|nr:cytochrome c oxidase assembly protein [Alphaproteobacteria bacterium]